MRKLYLRLACCVVALFAPIFTAHAGLMVNVEYIHKLIEQRWDIVVPYNPALQDVKVAANMKYLLTAVDRANEILNGKQTTDYGNDERYATLAAADTVASIDAVDRLIVKEIDPMAPKFFITTTPDTSEFKFSMSAKGDFFVDWGDGQTETITRDNTIDTEYSHKYDTAGEYKIGIGGQATEYSTADNTAAIHFYYDHDEFTIGIYDYITLTDNEYIASIDGSLGAVFGTIGDGGTLATQPRFNGTFSSCYNLSGSIPSELFAGVHGAPVPHMFELTFSDCAGLSGEIPSDLFAGVHGAPVPHMFELTFNNCAGLSGEIPSDLFAGIQGTPAKGMFSGTFSQCYNLSGNIPSNLFVGIQGAPAESMFQSTFDGCSSLTEIPSGLFAGIQGAPAKSMFANTFGYCHGLSGSIPEKLFAGIKGAAAENMFNQTFESCTGLTGCVPRNLFTGITDMTFDDIVRDDYPFSGTSLAQCPALVFTITTTPDTREVKFSMSAKGDFFVDWGDGQTETITRNDTIDTEYSHNYDTAGEYKIGFAGQATEYSTADNTAAIHFYYEHGSWVLNKLITVTSNEYIASIDGSLGAIFGTIGDGDTLATQPRFYKTFYYSENLSGSIPSELFAGVHGAPAERMFSATFDNCRLLSGEIPSDLFAGIQGAPAPYMFNGTFSNCGRLSGSIPSDLFAGIQGAPAPYMFGGTFSYCAGLTGSIPEKLFAGIQGAPAKDMFGSTFWACHGLSGSIPENLFAGIQGAPAEGMFEYTFGHIGQSGEIPEKLFAGIRGEAAKYMFRGTFAGSGVSGNIPSGLFAGIKGAAAENMFSQTFSGCTGLTGCVPRDLFAGITDMTFDDIVRDNVPFYNTSLARCPAPVPVFTITTIPDTSYFYFRMSARGDFFVDWGDGTVETITRDNTNTETYSHNYDAPGEYKIGMGGTATEYGTESVLRFDDYEEYGCWKWGYCDFSYFTSVEGSLGALFPTIGDGSAPGQQPSFYMTFYDNALSSVPENLFAGLHGTAAPSMFEKTFEGCTDLTEIPSGLFAGVQLTPANNIFKDTFYYCSGLTKIPSGLFAGIQGAPTEYMFAGTFGSCSGLTEIPPDLFAGIQGEPAKNMFGWTFEGCTSLTGPSAKIGDKYLYEIWSGDVGTWCYKRATGLSDYDDIPSDWK